MTARRSILTLVSILLLTVASAAQGITTRRSAQVLYGSAKSCSQPASIRFDKVRKVTKEWKKIRSEGVKKGSARYDLLISAMTTAGCEG